MAKKHNISFFGKDQGLIINTYDFSDKIHLCFIQKEENKWQKFHEGLQIALSIGEICEISDFLEKKGNNVNIIHSSPKTQDIKNFVFEFNKEKDTLFIKAKYDNKMNYRKFSKPLSKGDLRAFIKIWLHMENEKIETYHALEGSSSL